MSLGSLRMLVTMLQESTVFVANGVTVLFGEENVRANDAPLPRVVVVPNGGPLDRNVPGYYDEANPFANNQWLTNESIDLYLWAYDKTDGATGIDHAEAVEDLRAWTLQALQEQAPLGLKFYPNNGRWEQANSEVNRYGRAYVLNITADISIPGVQPDEATITDVPIDATIIE